MSSVSGILGFHKTFVARTVRITSQDRLVQEKEPNMGEALPRLEQV